MILDGALVTLDMLWDEVVSLLKNGLIIIENALDKSRVYFYGQKVSVTDILYLDGESAARIGLTYYIDGRLYVFVCTNEVGCVELMGLRYHDGRVSVIYDGRGVVDEGLMLVALAHVLNVIDSLFERLLSAVRSGDL